MLLADALTHPTRFPHHLRFVLHYGPQHASPNSGWPEAALAAILDCRFGGPHNYFGELFDKPFIGDHERIVSTQDMQLSLRICFVAEVMAVALFVLLLYASLHVDVNLSWWLILRGLF